MKGLRDDQKRDLVKYLVLQDEFERGKISAKDFEHGREALFNLFGGVQAFYDVVHQLGLDNVPGPHSNYDSRLADRIVKSCNLLGVEATNQSGFIATGLHGKKSPLVLALDPEHYFAKDADLLAALELTSVATVTSLQDAVRYFDAWRDFAPDQTIEQ